MKLKFLSLFLLGAFISLEASAVTKTVDFLKLGVGVRGTGMGESGTADCPDVISSYINPAGLADITKKELGFAHSEAVMDASLEFISFAYPVGRGTLGISGEFYIVKPIPVTLGSGETIGDLNWRGQVFALSYGRKISDAVSIGGAGKVIQQLESDPIFGKSEGTAYAADAGVICRTPVKGLSAGFSVLNSGSDLRMSGETRKDALPQTTRIGVAYGSTVDKNFNMTAACDIHRIIDGSWNTGAGLEISHRDALFIRAGYSQKEGNITGNTYGVGFKTGKLRIDYSNVPASEMVGYTRNNKVSLVIMFD